MMSFFKKMKWLLLALTILIIVYSLGPRIKKPNLNKDLVSCGTKIDEIEDSLAMTEAKLPIKPNNHSKIYWANNVPQKTEYVVLYLHGFSASPEEGAPVHLQFAEKYGANLYVPRLFEHGLKSAQPLINFTAEGYLQSVKQAFAVARRLGHKIIVMACSTGATAGLYLASGNVSIDALILYAPNIDLHDQTSFLITKPWGKQLLELIIGSEMYRWEAPPEAQNYWYTNYRIEAIIQLKALIEATMTNDVFEQIDAPLFVGYYYENEDQQDKIVSVEKIKTMFQKIGTPANKKRQMAFPKARTHGIQSGYFSKDFKNVLKESCLFADQVLGLQVVN